MPLGAKRRIKTNGSNWGLKDNFVVPLKNNLSLKNYYVIFGTNINGKLCSFHNNNTK